MSDDTAGIKKTSDGITPKLQALLLRAGNSSGALARAYPLYQKLQTERFMTENASEGSPWPALNPVYSKYKPKRYGGGIRHKWVGGQGVGGTGFDKEGRPRPWEENGTWNSYPGGGTKMLLGTTQLAGAVIGPGAPFFGTEQHRAMFTDSTMTILVSESGTNPDGQKFDYAHLVAEKRPFMMFGDSSIAQFRAVISKFMIWGE